MKILILQTIKLIIMKIKVKILLLLAVAFSATRCSTISIDKKQLVNDLVFSAVSGLEKKYGAVMIDEYDHSITLKLEGGISCMVFYADSLLTIPQIVRVKGADFDPELFYHELGWELPNLDWQQSIGKMTTNELHGMENAVYQKATKTLNIKLTDPDPNDFGKRIK